MNDKIKCPVCGNAGGGSCKAKSVGVYECDICGLYQASAEFDRENQADAYDSWNLTPVQRAVLSHRIRTKSSGFLQTGNELFAITSAVLRSLRSNGNLPSASVQAANIIRFVGDHVSRSGEAVAQLPKNLHAIIGALNRDTAIRLTKELEELKLLRTDGIGTAVGIDPATKRPFRSFTNITLSLDGWERYETEKRGGFEGNYGFIAMQFGDADFDTFVLKVVKQSLKEEFGYDIVDMRDVSEAGIIDNIMRVQIRDAAFVIADLTHENRGAYWEAGYAEGLGKPVIYICEKTKFDERRTHFERIS